MSKRLETYDFLRHSEEDTLRQEAHNILSSYSQVHDILAESLQNAVDTVDERYREDPSGAAPRIRVDFNVQGRSITVTDTGTGLAWEMLQNAPAPNITYKRASNRTSNNRSRGEKGVGLSFLTFTCNSLFVRTCNGHETIEAEITDANNWVNGTINERPMLVPKSVSPEPVSEELGSDTYTMLRLTDVRTTDYSEQDIFEMSSAELIYILRTKTALGYTKAVVVEADPDPNIQIELQYTTEDGRVELHSIPYMYLSPEEYIDKSSKLQYEEFLTLLKQDKMQRARGKALVYRAEKETLSGRRINCYAFAMAPNAFDELARDQEIEGGWVPDSWVGIFISTRGMPTGIQIEPPQTGSAGYWRRVFILLEDDEMNFDVGRKSLQGRAKPMMQDIAKSVWSDISTYLQKLTPADTEAVVRRKKAQLSQLFREAETEWADLDLESVQYCKEPKREQMVVALFYELVGAGLLRGYRTIRNNTIDQYDAFIRYYIDKRYIGKMEAAAVQGSLIKDDIIVEFKYNAQSILRDLLSNSKRYHDIDLLVCWEIDIEYFEEQDISVEVISPDSVYYFGSTHFLYFPGSFEAGPGLTLLELKSFTNNLKST